MGKLALLSEYQNEWVLPAGLFGQAQAFGGFNAVLVCLVGGTLAAGCFVAWRVFAPQPHTGPKAMFHALCRAHALNRGARKALHTLARHHNLKHPGRLFLEQELFDAVRGSSELARIGAQLTKVREQLFNCEKAPRLQ